MFLLSICIDYRLCQVFFQSNEIYCFSSESELKAKIVERFNKTIEEKF